MSTSALIWSISISLHNLQQLESTQSNLIKRSLGPNTRSKSSCLLNAFGVAKVDQKIKFSISSLMRRIFALDSPDQDLVNYFLCTYLSKGTVYPGRLVERVLSHGLSPINCIFNKLSLDNSQNCGIVDSLKVLFNREH